MTSRRGAHDGPGRRGGLVFRNRDCQPKNRDSEADSRFVRTSSNRFGQQWRGSGLDDKIDLNYSSESQRFPQAKA